MLASVNAYRNVLSECLPSRSNEPSNFCNKNVEHAISNFTDEIYLGFR